MVRSPAGSTSLARCKASDVAKSALAGVTARMIALSPCTSNKLTRSIGRIWSITMNLLQGDIFSVWNAGCLQACKRCVQIENVSHILWSDANCSADDRAPFKQKLMTMTMILSCDTPQNIHMAPLGIQYCMIKFNVLVLIMVQFSFGIAGSCKSVKFDTNFWDSAKPKSKESSGCRGLRVWWFTL